jgi:hypothetical protein
MDGPAAYYSPSRVVLLTGAGFSKNFGGLLASEMWSLILNQPDITASERLRQCLLENFDYEQIYNSVTTSGNYTNDEKIAFTGAVEKAYRALDDSIRFEPIYHRGQTTMMLQSFLTRFQGSGNERSFLFTLNQDLLVERYYTNENGLLQMPGIGHPDWFTSRFTCPMTVEHEIELPNQAGVDKWKAQFWTKGSGIQNFLYLKLHGSYGWRTGDAATAMVIGTGKAELIANQPLLRWYLDLFKTILNYPRQLLVVTGYGFMDQHINNVIADAIRDAELRLHVISPNEPKHLSNILRPVQGVVSKPTPRGAEIWNGLQGYTCGSVLDLVQHSSNELTSTGQAFFREVGLL